MKRLQIFFIALLTCSFFHVGTANADKNIVQVYSLKHQLAESLLPTLNSTLLPDESINAYNNELVVNASPASQQKVEQLLQTLDTPLRNVQISVRNNNTGNSINNNTGVSGVIHTGEVYLGAGGPVYREKNNQERRGSDGGIVIQSDGARIHSNHEVRQTSTQQEQKLRAIEGSPAWISTGQAIPYRSTDRWGNTTTEYQNADRGFYVTARIIGDRVQLDISTSNDKLSEDPHKSRRGVIDTERVQTTVSGTVGDWIPLGGIHLQDNSDNRSYNNRSYNDSNSIGDISVRVIPLD
ncbi:MAG TPA: secretin N-terminal domain-containing protein [Pseudomonadales bacterium]|nr:secretin N-terminal domain-containing protein [Pseudomonadales bacterium]